MRVKENYNEPKYTRLFYVNDFDILSVTDGYRSYSF